MKISEAYEAVFGSNPERATQDAIEIIKQNSDLDVLSDDDFGEIPGEVRSRYASFRANPDYFLAAVADQNLKSLLEHLLPKKEDEDKNVPVPNTIVPHQQVAVAAAPVVQAVTAQNLLASIGKANKQGSVVIMDNDDGNSGDDNDDDRGNKKGKKGKQNRNNDNWEPPPLAAKPLPPVEIPKPVPVSKFVNLSSKLPDEIVRLLKEKSWCASRKAIEQTVLVLRDHTTSKEGRVSAEQKIVLWKQRMRDYRNGALGEELCLFGRHMAALHHT
ncbi:MAG: hypothetical protein AAB664_00525 [Patescibacteria group bacterium]